MKVYQYFPVEALCIAPKMKCFISKKTPQGRGQVTAVFTSRVRSCKRHRVTLPGGLPGGPSAGSPPGTAPRSPPQPGHGGKGSPNPEGLLPKRSLRYISLAPHPLHHLVAAKQKEEFLKRIWFRFDTENCLIRYKSPKAGRGFDKTKEVPLRLLAGGGGVFFFLPQREVTQNK